MSEERKRKCPNCGATWEGLKTSNCPRCSSFAAPVGSARDRRVESAHRLAMLALQSKRYSDDHEYRDAVDAVLSWSLPAWTAQCQAPND